MADERHPFLELIRRRASVEDFDPDRPVDEATIRALVEDATRAPSSFNIQHWRFVAVRDPEARRRLQQAAYGQAQVSRAPVTFIVLGDIDGVERLPGIMETAVARGAIAAGKASAWIRMAHEIYGDPLAARDEAVRSASLAAMTLMYAATARGLASGALTGFDPERVASEFGIDRRLVPVMLIVVGYPIATVESSMPRLPVAEVLAFERWGSGEGES